MSKEKKVQSSSQQRTLWQETWRRFKKNKLAVAGMIFLIALVVIAIATIIIDAVNPSIYETYVIKQNLRERLAPPSAAHIFGQDEFGRDMLMRILWRFAPNWLWEHNPLHSPLSSEVCSEPLPAITAAN